MYSWIKFKEIVNVIELAAQIILQVYTSGNFMVESKSDESPLTIADKKANEFICRELLNLHPDIPIISEENKNDSWEKRKNYKFAWLVDPLDGTKEFIKRNGEFTVNIGLVENGVPVAGFVNIPVQGKTYWAIRGMGAYVKENGEKWCRLEESWEEYGKRDNKKKVICSRSHMNEETKKFISNLGNVELVNVGSSIKIIWIAEKKADVYPRIAPTMEWDTCATHAILNEVGGCLKIFPELGEEVRYNKENLLNPYFVASLDFEG